MVTKGSSVAEGEVLASGSAGEADCARALGNTPSGAQANARTRTAWIGIAARIHTKIWLMNVNFNPCGAVVEVRQATLLS